MAERDEVRWGLARRFEFIEWRAYWTGRVNRKHIEDQFGVSTPQASVDLKMYQEIVPGNIYYDSTEKAYLAGEGFVPRFLLLSADRYLLQLGAILNGAIHLTDTWFSSPPPASVMPSVLRSVHPDLLRTVLKSIEQRREINVMYQSLTNTRERAIVPHAIASDGHRWHARAWCVEREEFRDFVLTRILSVGTIRDAEANPTHDVEWNTLFPLKLIAHRRLGDAQRIAVERDFGMINGERIFTMRLALAFYFVSRMNLDLDDELVPPERKQLQLVNFAELKDARQAAKGESRRMIATRLS